MSGSNKLFSGMPSINIPRSRWNDSYNVTGSFKHGFLVPIDCIPVLPGDGVSYQLKDITRMQTPIAPIFGNIKQHFVAFFIPMRLVWEHTEEFFGANKTSAGYQTGSYTLPHAKFEKVEVGSLSHYLGKPVKGQSETDADGNAYFVANILKERCYYLCHNEYFRAQQITNPVILNVSDSADNSFVQNKVGTFGVGGTNVNPGIASGSLLRVAKDFDYFTASTISPQYGAAVELPLGASAPVYIENVSGVNATTGYTLAGGLAINAGAKTNTLINFNASGTADPATTATQDPPFKIYADLSTATAAKVNDVRYAFAVQKYLERANFAGNYFFGILQVHYGVTSPDSRLQRPEFLGSYEEDILVHQVVSTTDTLNSSNQLKTPVGSTGAMSVTASGGVNLFNKSFVEPGYILIMRYCRHRQVYSQGVMREDFKKDRFEIYTPELCNLGDQATLKRELYWKAGEKAVFGYQEHWAEYRYRPDRVTGLLDPAGGSGQAKWWTLANEFSSAPALDDNFILESRDNLDRCLTTGSSLDEYICDTWANITWTREMPVRTIPGLIDHFGAM